MQTEKTEGDGYFWLKNMWLPVTHLLSGEQKLSKAIIYTIYIVLGVGRGRWTERP